MKIKYILFCCCLLFAVALILNGCSNNRTNDSELSKPTLSTTSNNAVSPTVLTNIPEEIDKVDINYLKSLGIVIRGNYDLWEYKAGRLVKLLGYKYDYATIYRTKIKLPKDFNSIVNKVEIGKFLFEKNKQSKGYGFDFSNYMGKELFLFDAQVTKDNIKSGYILILFDAEKMVGAWHDESNENNDVNTLLSGGVIITRSN